MQFTFPLRIPEEIWSTSCELSKWCNGQMLSRAPVHFSFVSRVCGRQDDRSPVYSNARYMRSNEMYGVTEKVMEVFEIDAAVLSVF